MSFELICGPAGSGKTRAAMDAFLEELDRGGTPLYIVPSGPDARHFRRQLLRRRQALLGGEVLTFERLYHLLVERAGRRLRYPEGGEKVLLAEAALAAAGELELLSRQAPTPGFTGALCRFFDELLEQEIDPARLGGLLRSWAGSDRRRRALTGDLFRVYSEYHGLLAESGTYDLEPLSAVAARLLEEQPGLLGGELVVIDGFWDFTWQERRFIGVLARTVPRLLVTLPWEEGRLATAAVADGLGELKRAGAEVVSLPRRNDPARPLAHLEAHLFEEGEQEVLPAGEAVCVLRAAGERGQAALVAEEVLRLWRRGTALDDIAIVCRRSTGPEAQALAAACERLGVPAELAAALPFNRTALGRTLAAALDYAANPGDAGRFLAYLRSPLPVAPGAQVDRFERFLKTSRRPLPADHRELVAAWENGGGRRLPELERLLKARDRRRELAAALRENAAYLVSAAAMGSRGAGESDTGDLAEDLAALAVLESFCERQATAPDGAAADEGAVALLSRALAAERVRLPAGTTRGCVRILDPHRVLNQRFDVVFACGLLEGNFPSGGREDVFIDDAGRAMLNRDQGTRFRTREQRLDQERFLFHRTLSRARERIYLCFPYCDEEGRPTVPSLFVGDALSLFEEGSWGKRDRGIGELVHIPEQAPTESAALAALAALAGDGNEGLALEAAAAAGLEPRLQQVLTACRPPVVSLGAEVLDVLGERRAFRVTELERYLECPFRYFLEHLVDPQDLTPEKIMLRRGILAHRILSEFGRQMRASGVHLPRAERPTLAAARREMAAMVDRELEGEEGLEAAMLRVQLHRYLERFVAREAACRRRFKPYDFEVSFGGDDGPGMLKLGEIAVSGRIDRVDLEEGSNRALAIDYKTGDVHGAGAFAGQGLIQLPLYLRALKNVMGLEPVAGEYYSLSREKRRGVYLEQYREELCGECPGAGVKSDLLDAAEFEELLSAAEAAAREAAAGIRGGDFPAQPLQGEDTCKYCDLAHLCRRGEDGESDA